MSARRTGAVPARAVEADSVVAVHRGVGVKRKPVRLTRMAAAGAVNAPLEVVFCPPLRPRLTKTLTFYSGVGGFSADVIGPWYDPGAMASLFRDLSVDAGDFSSVNAARLSLSVDARARSGRIESKLLFYDVNTGGVREQLTVEWKVVSMTHSRRGGRLRTFALGEDGQVVVIEKEAVWRRDIERESFNAPRLGPLRKIRAVGDAVIAVGMNRQVYLLDEEEVWHDVSAPRTDAKPVSGFEAVAGFGQDNFLCAGWQGEIWQRKSARWSKLKSPTQTMVTDLSVGPGKTVVACGLGGLVMTRSATAWSVLKQKATQEDLFSVAHFGGAHAFASLKNVYTLVGKTLVRAEIDKNPTTCHTLCAVDGGLAAIGSKGLYLLTGRTWRRIE